MFFSSPESWTSNWLLYIITKRAFANLSKLRMSQFELCQSTKIPLKSTVFSKLALYELWLWRRKLSFLTWSEALRLWKLFFGTVSITWVDKSQKCCWIEDLVSKSYSFQMFFNFLTRSLTFWPWIQLNDSRILNDYVGLVNAGNSFVFRFEFVAAN